MKTMTCKQLGGACDKEFKAETFQEIARMSREHALEMLMNGDRAHADALVEMKERMQNPFAMDAWFEGKKQEFEAMAEA